MLLGGCAKGRGRLVWRGYDLTHGREGWREVTVSSEEQVHGGGREARQGRIGWWGPSVSKGFRNVGTRIPGSRREAAADAFRGGLAARLGKVGSGG